MKITAVIPVRQGSQRVKNKSLRAFGDTNLLRLKISVLKTVPQIDEIIVNTDADEALRIADELGVQGHRREAYYASSECSNSDFLEHLGKVTDTEVFAYCPSTTPFITQETISHCIDTFKGLTEHDCLATVTPVKEFMWLNNEPINYTRDKQPNSQNLPDINALNFGLNLIKRTDLIQHRNIVALKPYFVVTDEVQSIDIDTTLDFFIAESLYQKTVIQGMPIL